MSFDDSDFISFTEVLGEDPPATPGNSKNKKERRTSVKRSADDAALDEDEDEALLRSVDRSTPWVANVNWDLADTAPKQLHAEILAFVDYITPTQPEHALRIAVVESIRRAVQNRWDDAVVEPFGSFQTELYLPSGDIDLVVLCPSMGPLPSKVKNSLYAIAALLRARQLATDIVVIHKARVPIIKFKSSYGKFAIDISINRPGGPSAGRVVKQLIGEAGEVAAKSLIMVVKAFLMQRGLNEVFSGGLGSYSIICMVISFLQLHPKVQTQAINPSQNLGVLLVEFLELYGRNFNFDLVGVTVKPPGGYFNKVKKGWQRPNQPYLLSIEDPQDASNDISGGSHNILTVRQSLSGAFELLSAALCQRKALLDASAASRERQRQSSVSTGPQHDPCKQSILCAIIGMHPEVTAARNINAELALSGLLHQQLGMDVPKPELRRSFSQRASSPSGSADMDLSESEPSETPVASTSTATSVAPEESKLESESVGNKAPPQSEKKKGKRKAVAEAVEGGEETPKKKKKKEAKAKAEAEFDRTLQNIVNTKFPDRGTAKLSKAQKLLKEVRVQVQQGISLAQAWHTTSAKLVKASAKKRLDLAKEISAETEFAAPSEEELIAFKSTLPVEEQGPAAAESGEEDKKSVAKERAKPKVKAKENGKAAKKAFSSAAQFLPPSEDEKDADFIALTESEDDSRYSVREKKKSRIQPSSPPPTPKAKKAKQKKADKSEAGSKADAAKAPPTPAMKKPNAGSAVKSTKKTVPPPRPTPASDFTFVGDSDSELSDMQEDSEDDDLVIHADEKKRPDRAEKKAQYWASKREPADQKDKIEIDYSVEMDAAPNEYL